MEVQLLPKSKLYNFLKYTKVSGNRVVFWAYGSVYTLFLHFCYVFC